MELKFLNKILYKVKIIKIAEILRINPHFFFDFLIFHFSKLFRANVNDNLIIFGAANGKAFIGNPKYLYYYLKKNTNYNLVWFTKSDKLNKELKRKGIKCVNNFSLEAIKLLRKARAVFVSHGWGDILPVKFPPRTVVIQTWHGGFIKVKGKHAYVSKYINSKWTTLTRTKIRYDQFFDFAISASFDMKLLKITSDVFRFPIKKILVTGYPRNDILFSNDQELIKRIKLDYNIPDSIEKIILYAPTYRELANTRNPFDNEDLLKINKLCKDTNTYFLIKAHIYEKIINFSAHENIKLVNKDADIQELLLISDILISDYSSVICDYVLTNRPILLYTYDYDDYVRIRGIYYSNLEEIAPGPLLYSIDELITAIKNIKEIFKNYSSKAIEVRDFFNKYKDANSSERLLRFLKLIE